MGNSYQSAFLATDNEGNGTDLISNYWRNIDGITQIKSDSGIWTPINRDIIDTHNSVTGSSGSIPESINKNLTLNSDGAQIKSPAGMSGLDQWKVGLGVAQFANGLYNDSKQRSMNNRLLKQKDTELALMQSKFDMTAADVGYTPAWTTRAGFDEFNNISGLDKYSKSHEYAASTAHSRARNNANLAFG